MADFLLSVGVDTKLSYTQMQNDITDLVNDLSKNTPRIKVAFEIDKSVAENLRKQITEINKSVESSGSTSRDVSTKSQQYRDVTRAIKEYYAVLTQLSKSKSDVSLTTDGWKSASGNYNELASALNRTRTAFDLVSSSVQSMPASQQVKIQEMLTSETNKYNIAVEQQANKEREAASQYKDVTRVIKEYYAVLTQLSKSKSDISLTTDGWKSASGNYNELASALNRTRTAFDLVSSSVQSMPASQQIKIQEMLTSETNKYNIAVEQQANKERIAAEVSAQKAQRQKEAASSKKQANTAIKSYETALIQCETALRNWTAAEHSKNLSSQEAYQSLKSSVEAAKNAREAYNSGSVGLKHFREKTEEMRLSLKSTERVIKENGDATKTWSEKMAGLAGKFGSWLTTSQIIMQAIQTVRQIVKSVIDVDTAMTELKKVTNEADVVYEKFLTNAAVRTRDLGASLSDTVTATADFARLGFSIEDAANLADAAIVYKNVGDGIKNIDDASESIISTMQAFKDEINPDDVMLLVDKFNEVGNNYAISSKGVGDALLRSASAMHAANNSLDETIALVTAANTVIQNPEKVGTALKTISMFLRAAKTEAAAAGEATDGMATSVSKLRETILSLTGGKVDIQIDEDNFKSTYQILKEISLVWHDLSDITRANILEKIGGKRNSNVAAALLENFSVAEEALEVSSNSSGSALAENEKYLESIQGRLDILKASFQDLANNLVDSGLIKFFVNTADILVNILNFVVKISNAVGGLKTVLLAIASIHFIRQGELLKNGVPRIKDIKNAFIGAKNAIKQYAEERKKAKALDKADKKDEILKKLKLFKPIEGVKDSAENVKGLSSSVGILTTALTIVCGVISAYNNYMDEMRRKTIESAKKSSDLCNDIYTLSDRYFELNKAVNTDENAKKELLSVQDDLIKKLGTERSRVEELRKEYGNYADVIRYLTKEKIEEEQINLRAGIEASGEEMVKAANKFHFDTSSMNDIGLKYVGAVSSEENAKIINDLINAGYVLQESLKAYNGTHILLPEDGYDLSTVEGVIAAHKRLGDMLKFVADSAGTENEVWKALYNQYNKVTDELEGYNNMVDTYNKSEAELLMQESLIGKELPRTKEAFTELKAQMLGSAYASKKFIGSNEEIEDVIDKLLSSQSQFSDFYEGSVYGVHSLGNSADESYLSISDLAGSLTKLKSAYSIVQEAQKDMASGNGLSAKTIKTLAKETEDYVDFLYEENGVLKLNIEDWKQYSSAKMESDIDTAKSEIEALEKQREEIQQKIDDMERQKKEGLFASERPHGIVPQGTYTENELNSELAKQTALLNANAAALEANKNKLDIQEAAYDSVTHSADAYKEAVSGFEDIKYTIDSVSKSFTTLADLQESVAKGFTLSLDEALKFATVYPEILDNATFAADGQIALNEDTVNSFIDGKNAELRAGIDATIASLERRKKEYEADKAFAEIQLKFAESAAEGKVQISGEEAANRVEASKLAADALIQDGVDEATAFKIAAGAMSANVKEFNDIAKDVATDINGNFDSAAYSAAQSIYINVRSMKKDLSDVTKQAHEAALAIAGVANGKISGSTKIFNGGTGGKHGPVANIRSRANEFVGTDTGDMPIRSDVKELEGALKTLKDRYRAQMTDHSFDKLISGLKSDIASYTNAISQIDGQIETLRALRNTSLNKFASSRKKSDKKHKGDKSGSAGGKGNKKSDDPSWFEVQYKLHNHLLNMDAENVSDYLEWLDDAHKRAYNERIISLDEFYKYQEEVYKKLQDLFKDYISDVEHEISMRENFKGESKKILSLYKELVTAVENEIKSARAKGLNDTDDYIQELQSKWAGYKDSIRKIQDEAKDDAKSAIDKLIEIRVDMLKRDIDNEIDALDKKLKYLSDFYNKQKELLQDKADEDKYLDEQSEHRKTVADIQAELTQLDYDNSAWAQKRKLELAKDLADAQKDLDDFEKDHALQVAQDQLDSLYEMQEKELDSQKELLNKQKDDTKSLYDQALADIKDGSIGLYNEMIEWNNLYGDGIEETIKTAWEGAYVALQNYYDLYGKYYKDVQLANATGYTKPKETWDTSSVSGTNPSNKNIPAPSSSDSSSHSSSSSGSSGSSKPSAPSLSKGSYVQVKPGTKWYADSYGGGPHGRARSGKIKYINASGPYSYNIDGLGWVRKKDIVGYSSGTKRAKAGLHSLDEQGTETLFVSTDGTKYRMFTGGEKVLNAKASNFLYDFANGGGGILKKIFQSCFGAGLFDRMKPAVSVPEIVMGDIIIQGNADRQTVSEIRRSQRENLSDILKAFNKLNK